MEARSIFRHYIYDTRNFNEVHYLGDYWRDQAERCYSICVRGMYYNSSTSSGTSCRSGFTPRFEARQEDGRYEQLIIAVLLIGTASVKNWYRHFCSSTTKVRVRDRKVTCFKKCFSKHEEYYMLEFALVIFIWVRFECSKNIGSTGMHCDWKNQGFKILLVIYRNNAERRQAGAEPKACRNPASIRGIFIIHAMSLAFR